MLSLSVFLTSEVNYVFKITLSVSVFFSCLHKKAATSQDLKITAISLVIITVPNLPWTILPACIKPPHICLDLIISVHKGNLFPISYFWTDPERNSELNWNSFHLFSLYLGLRCSLCWCFWTITQMLELMELLGHVCCLRSLSWGQWFATHIVRMIRFLTIVSADNNSKIWCSDLFYSNYSACPEKTPYSCLDILNILQGQHRLSMVGQLICYFSHLMCKMLSIL